MLNVVTVLTGLGCQSFRCITLYYTALHSITKIQTVYRPSVWNQLPGEIRTVLNFENLYVSCANLVANL